MARAAKGDEVLDSAAALFAANGFAATSVREVADRAQLTKAGLYYHIRGKEDLLYSICAHSIETILAGARRAVAEAADPRSRIRALIRNHAAFFERHPDNLTVLTRDMNALSDEPRAAIRKLERDYLALIRGTIAEGQKTGMIRRVDPSVAAFTLLAALNTLNLWYKPRGKVKPAALIDQLETLVTGGLFAAAGEG